MRVQDQIRRAYAGKISEMPYEFIHYKSFDYSKLKYIYYIYPGGSGVKETYNDVIIMADTETSKKVPDVPYNEKGIIKYKTAANHVVCWTISIRAFHHNICTLYGRKPSSLIKCLTKIHQSMSGQRTIVYWHNLSYDHIFIRKFAYELWGRPTYQLNVKSHYPILIQFSNGIMFKDSLILAQRKLEKWAEDLEVEHQKEVGKWDYDLIRNQSDKLTQDELDYIEHDTLAGVECLDKTMEALNKKIYSLQLTATGIPRLETKKRGKKKAHDDFKKIVLTYEQYDKFNQMYHGGYSHGNRHYINMLINWALVKAGDFSSSYPFILCAFKFPMEKFTALGRNCSTDFILKNINDYAYAFKFIVVNIRLKSDAEPMPVLQFSKCIKTINPINDNGRILCANYVEIYLTEFDLKVIERQYTWDKHICTDVEFAAKGYLPRWFTDYVYQCYSDKCKLKGKDPVLYSIAKAKTNSLYGMCCQKSIRDEIIENYDTGDFDIEPLADPEESYKVYTEKISSILPFQWGCWVCAAALANVHEMATFCRIPLYMDTDSCYGIDWDIDKVNAYNQKCKDMLAANGYGAVEVDGREYWMGIIEHEGDKDTYTEFKYMGAKRYCGRQLKDGKLHITVAGVPKKKGALCLKDDINNFVPGFIFSGLETNKKTHVYINEDKIYIDKAGNETGDSISLIPCDYSLDSVIVYDWEALFNEEINIQIYDEEEAWE